MALFIIAIIAGVEIGCVYAAIGVGYVVVYKATSTFNLAQGDLVMVAIMTSYFLLVVLHWPKVLAFPAIIVFVCAISMFEERTVVRRFLNRRGLANLGWFIGTLGFSLVVETIVNLVFLPHAVVAIPSPVPNRGVGLGAGIEIPYQTILIVVTFALMVVLLQLFYRRTWTGRAMRATSEDRVAVSLLGIDPGVMSRTAFAIAGVAAAVAGIGIAPLTASDPTVGLALTLKGFIALTIGGFESIGGVIIGGVLLGCVEQVFDLYVGATYEIAAGLVLVLVVLLFRPEGLYRSSAARTV